MSLASQTAFLTDLAEKRGQMYSSGLDVNFIRHYGGDTVPMSHYQIDPETSRTRYYYNTTTNELFMLIKAARGRFWKRIGG